jgi:hypothetical protein
MREKKAPACEFCPAPNPELIALSVPSEKGLRIEMIRVWACRSCTTKGFAEATRGRDKALADLPRRRAILKLNQEYEALLAKKAPSEAIEANRAAKTELVLMAKKNAKALRAALALMEG